MGKAFFPGAQVTQNRTVTKMATTVTMVTDESYSPGDLCTAHKTLQKSPNLFWAVKLVTFLEDSYLLLLKTALLTALGLSYPYTLPWCFSLHWVLFAKPLAFIDSVAVYFPLPFWQLLWLMIFIWGEGCYFNGEFHVDSLCCCYWYFPCILSRPPVERLECL